MSDGMSDATREEREGALVEAAARAFVNALKEVNDAAFGLSWDTLDIVNAELHLAGLRVRLEYFPPKDRYMRWG